MSYAHSARIALADMLGTLDHLAARAEAAGLPDAILAERLTEDMFPLELQFRIAINQVLLALNQVAGAGLPLEEAACRSLGEVRARIAAVRLQLDQSDPAAWPRAEAPVDLTLPNGVRFLMSAEADLRDWILPNLYFHVTVAYALLRRAGVPLGKMDLLGHMARHEVPAAR